MSAMLKSSLCDHSDAYILVNENIAITGRPAGAAEEVRRRDKRNKGIIFKIVHHSLTAEAK